MLRFWLQRLTSDKPQTQMPIGLIYGPSGCGKSSLVRAGIIPRLPASVTCVVVNARPTGLEQTLADEFGSPLGLSAEHSLPQLLKAIRRDPSSRKVLLVIDQLEQWLQAWDGDAQAELVEAMRQCDGQNIQALLLVRDDFGWLPPLLAGTGCATCRRR